MDTDNFLSLECFVEFNGYAKNFQVQIESKRKAFSMCINPNFFLQKYYSPTKLSFKIISICFTVKELN